SSSTLPPVTTTSIPTVTPSEIAPIRQYTRRAKIAQSSTLPTDRVIIAKSSTLPYDSAPRVTSPAADEGSMQQTINELMDFCTSLQRQHSKLLAKFQAQEGKSLDEGEAAFERTSNDTEEMATVLTSMDTATVLVIGAAKVPTDSGSIPTTGPPAAEVPTGSDVVPTTSLVFATATVVARELEEQLEREEQRRSKQIAKDAEIARIHAEEELQIMIDGLDRKLISDLVKYQDNYAKVYKFQSQQRKPWTKKQKRDYYMAVIRSNLGWKVKHFRGMKFEEVKAKFNSFWKQMEDFIPMGLKEETARIKRKGLSLEQESAKKQKTSEEVTKEAKSPDEVPKEKVKEMMQLVPIEEVYVKALQVKQPIIDWKVHTKGQRSYWKITRLGGSLASYQFFINLLKHLDREDLNQLWRLVKETLSNRPPISDKEMKL
nr:hypothetical protein [Tanacetum cinerariifolium]